MNSLEKLVKVNISKMKQAGKKPSKHIAAKEEEKCRGRREERGDRGKARQEAGRAPGVPGVPNQPSHRRASAEFSHFSVSLVAA